MEARRNWVKNRITHEMGLAAMQLYYSEEVIDHQRYGKQFYNIIVASLSSGGAVYMIITSLSDKYGQEPYQTIVSTALIILVGLVALANQFSNIFFIKNEDYSRLLQLHSEYASYLYDLEELYGWMDDPAVGTETLEERFRILTEQYAVKLTEASRLFGKTKKRWLKKAERRYDNRMSILCPKQEDNKKQKKVQHCKLCKNMEKKTKKGSSVKPDTSLYEKLLKQLSKGKDVKNIKLNKVLKESIDSPPVELDTLLDSKNISSAITTSIEDRSVGASIDSRDPEKKK
jgi:hypothetical protein